MPSIPQSLLWISLVVLWLFVLVPMLISKRDSVRRTSDVALATRVLNSGRNAQRLRRGPAAGHHSDPHWKPSADHLDDNLDAEFEEDLDDSEAPAEAPVRATAQRTVVVAAATVETPEPDYLDVDVVDEDSGALPVGTTTEVAEDEAEPELELEYETEPESVAEPEAEPEPEPVAEAEPVAEPVAEAEAVESEAQTERIAIDLDEAEESDEVADDEYEYVADSSGLEPEAEDDPAADAAEAPVTSLNATRQRRFESKKAAEISARKFRFRKRMLAALAAVMVFSAAAAFLVTPSAWWVCGTAATLTVLYLAYLRRQTRIEEQLRRRRAQRMARSRLGVESTDDHKLDVVPARLRRPGAVVLDIDDEDPIFEHLAYRSMTREYDLPRASGQ